VNVSWLAIFAGDEILGPLALAALLGTVVVIVWGYFGGKKVWDLMEARYLEFTEGESGKPSDLP
jgi:hypothetical protein